MRLSPRQACSEDLPGLAELLGRAAKGTGQEAPWVSGSPSLSWPVLYHLGSQAHFRDPRFCPEWPA